MFELVQPQLKPYSSSGNRSADPQLLRSACVCQAQLEISHPGLSLGDYITAILGWLVQNNLYPFK
jgi:hypothetical protein